MIVLSFRMDVVVMDDGVSRLFLLTTLFENKTTEQILLSEDQLHTLAMTMTMAVQSGAVAPLASLEHRGGPVRATEFLGARETLGLTFQNPTDIEIQDLRSFAHGGGIVVAAATSLCRLFIAVFDPFSTEAFVVSADDCLSAEVSR